MESKIILIMSIILISWTMLEISNITKKMGFKKLKIQREISNSKIFEGEVFSIKTTVENNKLLPLSFLVINEVIPDGIKFNNEVVSYKDGSQICHISRYKIGWYERRKRTYELVAEKRGAYILKNIRITVGDIFGLSAESIDTENYVEVLVYPRLRNISSYNFDTTSFQGDNTVKRWILKDTLYIKGIREYNVEDRMKDIHWKTSLKMDKLMVKDYDTTSDKEVVIIMNVQCGDPAWSHVVNEAIENGIRVAVSLASKAVKEGIATGIWTNARIISMNGNLAREVKPDLNSFKRIIELLARVDSEVKVDFNDYLRLRANKFNKNTTYVVITPFLNEKSIGVLNKLCKSGFKLKIIDVSINGDIPFISGIEKITYKGEKVI
ncbi:DUF58 domain-containing protein [Clostridium sp. CS001]|uniref:DUF58 domain-containing protein n=1 Tax=Clostridium sp. CS001 TaxID=2880648 RepID=UPI001CF2C835|nr:DUF58 domain-containing protein [Clostridium sp. CS001]MCB2290217.1 DUF58 domain-containing protein [Clostridium sp. CS001]